MSFSITPTQLQALSIVELLAVIQVIDMIADGNGAEVDALIAEMEA